MKRAYLLLLAAMFTAAVSKAQDTIVMANQSKIIAKVLEINPSDIRYKDYNNPDGPTITIMKNGVAMIKYANGQKNVFDDPNNGVTVHSNYTRDGRDNEQGYRRSARRSSKLHGWYFGAGLSFGSSNASSSDPSYTTSGSIGTGDRLYAVKMFNQHLGICFGLGSDVYNYNVNDLYSYGYPSDIFTLSCLTIPIKVVYFSNSKKRVGLYAMAGFDISFLMLAKDQENDDLSTYYNPVVISPNISVGVAFRNRSASTAWMFGPYYKTSITNCYSGNGNSIGFSPGNTGMLYSAGLSITCMTNFRR